MRASRYSWQPLVLWCLGLLIFGALFPLNECLQTVAAPDGIASHRSAETAMLVNSIQAGWDARSLIGIASLNLALDYVFIIAFSLGGLFLSLNAVESADSVGSRRFAWLIFSSHLAFGLSDLTETTAQAIQLYNMQGSKNLIDLIHWVRPLTIVCFGVSVIGGAAILFGRFFPSHSSAE